MPEFDTSTIHYDTAMAILFESTHEDWEFLDLSFGRLMTFVNMRHRRTGMIVRTSWDSLNREMRATLFFNTEMGCTNDWLLGKMLSVCPVLLTTLWHGET